MFTSLNYVMFVIFCHSDGFEIRSIDVCEGTLHVGSTYRAQLYVIVFLLRNLPRTLPQTARDSQLPGIAGTRRGKTLRSRFDLLFVTAPSYYVRSTTRFQF